MTNNQVDGDNQEMTKQAMDFVAATRCALEHFENFGSIPSIIAAANSLSNCSGKVITSGMGKNGHIAAKSASTLSSLGISSCYLHPAEASHGDVGIVQPNDVLLVFSTSGKTREVIETIDLVKKLGISKVVSITSHPNSPVRDSSDLVVDIGIIKEAGFLSLAPTTSLVIRLVVSDIIATLCAWKRRFKIEEYALRHHSGYLGRKSRGEEP